MHQIPAHRYGPKSLLAFCVRLNMRDYREEEARAKKNGHMLIRRACTQMAWLLRKEFISARIV